jgi:ABC-type transport system substrate-binding protein
MASDLGKVGMNVTQDVVPQARVRDLEYNVSFPGLKTAARSLDAPGTLIVNTSEQCPTADRRFIGSNGGCWRNAAFDRAFTVASSSLDPRERETAYVSALKILSEDVGVIGLYYDTENLAIRSGVLGFGPRWPGTPGNTWNVYEWNRK